MVTVASVAHGNSRVRGAFYSYMDDIMGSETIDDGIAGCVVLVMQGAFVGYMQAVCIAPGWRGRGIGGNLPDFVEE